MKDIATTLFEVATSAVKPYSGCLLLAEPFLCEPFFRHSVIALIDYAADEGATGAVMNHATGYTLQDLLEGVTAGSPVPVFCGGPLGQDRLYYIHTLGDKIIPGARMFAPGVYVGGDFDAMIAYVNAGYPIEANVRFFIGYSSWTAGQLEQEIDEGSWVEAQPWGSPESLLTLQGDSYWHRAVRAMGASYRSWQLLPDDPHKN